MRDVVNNYIKYKAKNTELKDKIIRELSVETISKKAQDRILEIWRSL
jgi:hypothetical protein